mgnify:CR=1 FL=1
MSGKRTRLARLEAVAEIIADIADVEAFDVKPSVRLDSLGLDACDIGWLASELQDYFGLLTSAEDEKELETVEDVLNLLERIEE